MNAFAWESIDAIASAVLYEGFMLYPYRPSSVKNRQRWNFGVLFPANFPDVVDGFERCAAWTECLVESSGAAKLTARIRFLRDCSGDVRDHFVESPTFDLTDLIAEPQPVPVNQQDVDGELLLSAERLDADVIRVRATIRNLTQSLATTRDAALAQSLISAHLVLGVDDGRFVSLVDAPERWADHASACRNDGLWPVLVGDENLRNTLLAAPIILQDFPRIAPQSPHDLFDGCEIDEILTLRILTLTDAEKAEARTDPRTARLLASVEKLSESDRIRMHGVVNKEARGLRRGARVRLNPKRRADAFDVVLRGKTATVESVQQDYENRVHVAVSIDDDPGRDMGMEGRPGHRFFFDADEVEVL